MKKMYVETTIPSFATSRPSRDTITAGMQAATLAFWESERLKYELYISQFVINECLLGDVQAAARRIEFLRGLPVIPVTDEMTTLSDAYQKLLGIPDRAKIDCYHLAVSVLANMDYMLTWNCTHLGIHTFVKIQEYNNQWNLSVPLLVTPEALLGLDGRE
ncbi:MAG: type II toxin-antitoxin system VapC family toxin [Peptococcaceae bacterium]|nr:type II toxin-antitoxin system VapC family toxin [Peptococcaceae bacterium]